MIANILIIGSGISGVAIAYHLAHKGVKDIVVVDQSYMTSGATGRCGAGVRQQWATKANCLMAKRSIEFFHDAATILDYADDIEFKQEGYLILATDQEEHEQFTNNVRLQNSLNIPSHQLSVSEARNIVPHLNPEAFVSATFCPTDGHLNPFKMTDAYYQAAKRLGVTFLFFETVRAISIESGRIEKVLTSKRTILTHHVVNASGGYACEVGKMAGIDIPVYSENHEILVTEPIEKIQGPMVMSFKKNIYCQQVPHGSFLMGRSTPNQVQGHDISSSWQFLEAMAETVCEILPVIGKLRVVRQWGGSYNMSPDRQPIICEAPNLQGYTMACGFSGHGFMFAPMTGVLISEIILKEPPTLDVSLYHIDRFKKHTMDDIEKSVV
ncbi:MAG: FAD-binding oxidoreductase [Candidatus Izemoplasmatales bacterium]|jgi:sarcosine oxidase subunit beta